MDEIKLYYIYYIKVGKDAEEEVKKMDKIGGGGGGRGQIFIDIEKRYNDGVLCQGVWRE